MVRDRAHLSNLGKLGAFVVAFILAVIIATYLEPWTQEYEVKTAISLQCSELMKNRIEGNLPENMRDAWQSKLNRTGAKVKPQDWSFNSTHDVRAGQLRCVGKAKYVTKTDWAWVTIVKPDLKPLILKHDIVVVKEVADKW